MFHHVPSIADSFLDSTDANLLYTPNVTKIQWITPWNKDNPYRNVSRPCWILVPLNDYENAEWVLSQPTSSFFVMMVAVFCLYYALVYYKCWRIPHPVENAHTLDFSRLFWSLGLACWGVGAFVAGLSYEALEWNLKCQFLLNNNDFCVRYSWLEVLYVLFQVAACDFSLLASAFSSDELSIKSFWRIFWLGIFNYLIYSVVVASGALLGYPVLLSFELCVIFCGLSLLVGVYVNLWLPLTADDLSMQWKRYGQLSDANRMMLHSWAIMVLSGVVYGAYYSTQIEKYLWFNFGWWVTANDFLHIILTAWAISMGRQVDYVQDSAVLRKHLAIVLGGIPIPNSRTKKENGKMH